jgi:hypothetical protein
MRTNAFRVAAGIGVAIALAGVTVCGIRLFSDGPVAMLPGGPMSGQLVSGSFPGFEQPPGGLIELQVEGWRPSSRTVIGFLHEGNLYVPAVRAESKMWPELVLANSEVIVRHRGNLYERRAKRITDSGLISRLRETAPDTGRLTPEMFAADTTWYFRLDSR